MQCIDPSTPIRERLDILNMHEVPEPAFSVLNVNDETMTTEEVVDDEVSFYSHEPNESVSDNDLNDTLLWEGNEDNTPDLLPLIGEINKWRSVAVAEMLDNWDNSILNREESLLNEDFTDNSINVVDRLTIVEDTMRIFMSDSVMEAKKPFKFKGESGIGSGVDREVYCFFGRNSSYVMEKATRNSLFLVAPN